MSPFYTRTGDNGDTGILGESRLSKHHPRIETVGTLDEASAALGLARALITSEQTKSILMDVQRDLYALMSEVAAAPENASRLRTLRQAQGIALNLSRVEWLESQTDLITARVPVPKEFILPGDTPGGAALSLARTVVRRAERRLAELADKGEVENPALLPYLNRLSSLCFALELEENHHAGKQTTLAKSS
jgi:cob(I)alamin adenosyltransferase